MEFTVNKTDLVRELQLLQSAVAKQSTIPVLSTVLVEAAKDRIYLTASDLEISIRCPCPAKVKTSGSGAIPAKRLLDYTRLLPEEEIRVKTDGQFWATVACGRSRARMLGMSGEAFPALPEQPELGADIPLGAFTSMIGRTVFAVSSEDSKFALQGALLLHEGVCTMVATDGHRLALVEASGVEQSIARVLLPRKAMLQVLKLASAEQVETLSFSHGDNHLFFQIGERLLISREMVGNFPDYARVLPSADNQPHAVSVDREALRASIKRVAEFADERTHAVRLAASKGELKLRSSTSETGESEDNLSIDYEGPPVEIGLNADYLLDFLDATEEPRVTVLFKDGKWAVEMRPAGGSGYRYVVMPMRV